MTAAELDRWEKKYKNVKNVTNFAYSNEFDTVGCVTGDNVDWSDKNRDDLLTKYRIIHWDGITMSHMFAKKEVGVEPFEGGKVTPSTLEILLPSKKPLITDWDHLDVLDLQEVIDNPKFLQNIILKQEASIEKLKKEINELKHKCYKLENVYLIYMFVHTC